MSNTIPVGHQPILQEENKKTFGCYYGDICKPKHRNTVRIMFQNVNGFGYTPHSVKSNSIRKLIVRTKTDVMAMAEMNINWGKLSRRNTLPQLCKNWFE